MEINEAPQIPENAPPEAAPPDADLAEEITKDIETGTKPKKPRTEAQKAAFMKARDEKKRREIDDCSYLSGIVFCPFVPLYPATLGSKRY